MSIEFKKNEERNLYDLICKLIETGYNIETLSLYDGAEDLVFAAKDLKQFIEVFGVDFLNTVAIRKIEYDEDICHVNFYADEIIGQDAVTDNLIINYNKKEKRKMDGIELGCISIALLLIGWNIESIRQTMRSIANRVLGIEWEDDDDEIKDPSEKPYKSIYIEPTKEIIVDRDTRVCYLVNRVGGIVMMTNSDGTPKLYEGDLDDVKKQDEVKEIETEEEN